MSGLIRRSTSYPRPSRSSTPGENPSATMSDCATSCRAISSPRGSRMFSEIPRLPAFLLLNWPPMSGSLTPFNGPVARRRAARPPTGAIAASRVSGFSFHSTFRLSAPIAASSRVPPADARNHEKSRMRTPCNGNGLPCGDIVGGTSDRGRAGIGGAAPSARTASVSSPSSGARRPVCQLVSVLSHLLTAYRKRTAPAPDAPRPRSCPGAASAHPARSHAACAAASTAARPPAPAATARPRTGTPGRSAG